MCYYSKINNINVYGSHFYNKTDNKELKKSGLPDLER